MAEFWASTEAIWRDMLLAEALVGVETQPVDSHPVVYAADASSETLFGCCS